MIKITRDIEISEKELNALGYFKSSAPIDPQPQPGESIMFRIERTLEPVRRPEVGPTWHLSNDISADTLDDFAETGWSVIKWSQALPIDRAIGGAEMVKYQNTLRLMRDRGIKAQFRPKYYDGTVRAVPTMARIQEHVKQIGELLKDNRGAVAVAEAGYFGRWGEWHGDANITTRDNDLNRDNALRLKDWIDDSYPADLHKMVRYAKAYVKSSVNLKGWLGVMFDAPGNGLWGMHNDFIWGDAMEGSTWYNVPFSANPNTDQVRFQKQIAYGNARFTYYAGEPVPVGGDRGAPWDSLPDGQQPRTRRQIIDDTRLFGLSLLNCNGWSRMYPWMQKDPAAAKELVNTLGYNYYTPWVRVTPKGAQLEIEMEIENIGSSILINKRPLVVNVSSNNPVRVAVEQDARQVLPPPGKSATLSYLVGHGLTGRVNVGLSLPDPYNPENPKHAIQFSNKSAFTGGVNWLPDMVDL